MDSVSNPYFPGAGSPPAALVGRDAQILEWGAGISRTANGNTAQPIVLHGLRGVGKTVLLTRFAEIAEERGWLVAELEAEPGRPLREALGEALHEPLIRLARPSAGQRVLRALKTALSFKASYDTTGTWSFGLDLSQAIGGGADTGRIETDLERVILDVAAAAVDDGGGLAIVIDEAQDLRSTELAALSKVAQAASRRNHQVVIALAGLPSLPRVLGESKSYTERFNYQSIDALDDASAADAIEQPAMRNGVVWDPAAVDLLVAPGPGPTRTSCSSSATTPGSSRSAHPSPWPTHAPVRNERRPSSTTASSRLGGNERQRASSSTCARSPSTGTTAVRPQRSQAGSGEPCRASDPCAHNLSGKG